MTRTNVITHPYTVYLIQVDAQPVYIGQTVSPLSSRLSSHKCASKSQQLRTFFLDYLKECVESDKEITIHPLAYEKDESAALGKEQALIENYSRNGAQLFNRYVGRHSLDTRRRQSYAHRGISTKKRPILVRETRQIFPSLSECGRALDLLPSSISNALRTHSSLHGFNFSRLEN